MKIRRILAGEENIDKIDVGLGINTFNEVQTGMDIILTNLDDSQAARQNRTQTCINMFGRLQDNENGKRLVMRHVAKIADRIGYAGIVAGISAAVLTATAGIAYYLNSLQPYAKNLEAKVVQVQAEADTTKKDFDSLVATKKKDLVYEGEAYKIFFETDGTCIKNYRVEVEPEFPHEPKKIFDVEKDALYNYTGLIALIEKSKAYDKSQGRAGVLEGRAGYTPEQCIQLLQTLYEDDKGNITVNKCQIAHSRIAKSGGLKEITGVTR